MHEISPDGEGLASEHAKWVSYIHVRIFETVSQRQRQSSQCLGDCDSNGLTPRMLPSSQMGLSACSCDPPDLGVHLFVGTLRQRQDEAGHRLLHQAEDENESDNVEHRSRPTGELDSVGRLTYIPAVIIWSSVRRCSSKKTAAGFPFAGGVDLGSVKASTM